MTDKQSRFESWTRDRWQRESHAIAFGRDRHGKYFATATQIAWEAWQAAAVDSSISLGEVLQA